jgi:phage tail-like protein
MAQTGQRVEAHAGFRFVVNIGGIDGAVFSECTLPSLEVEIHEQKEGGYNTGVHMLPGRVKSGRITLKHGVARSNELLTWYGQVANGQAKQAERQVSVIMYDSTAKTEVMRLNFERAYPARWTGPAFNAAESAVAVETLELAFAEFTFQ